MELSKIIQDIKENFNLYTGPINKGPINTAIYIGVGTAAGYREADGTLHERNYHQFPPFLQSLKNSVQDLQLSIILIDPNQEDPPYMVKDKGLIHKGSVIEELNNQEIIDNIYTNQDQSLTVYTWRENVCTEPYNDGRGIDITAHLRELNQFAMDSGSIFIYHNFTGKSNHILAEFFDKELKDHLDHIIYGLGLREDVGCYFDLTDLSSYHPFYRDLNNRIKLFNIYNYIVNEKLPLLKNDVKDIDANIFNSHLEKILNIAKDELKNMTLQVLRTIFRLITGDEVKNHDKDVCNFTCFSGTKRNIYLNFINAKNYTGLYDLLLTDLGKKLDIVAICKGLDLTGREILEFITLGDDPFEWYNNVKHFL
jgi:hypothetical protein